MNDLISDELKEIVNFQNIIKTDELHYKPKHRKGFNFSEYSLPIVFKDMYMKNIYHWKMLMMSKVILMLN